jgi:sialate O-acetylesterase
MVVSIDTGDSLDVHPTDKKPIGERLSLLALAKTYQLSLDYSGPIFKEYQQKGNTIELSFDFARQLQTSDGLNPRGFILQGFNLGGTEASFFYPEKITLFSDKIILTLPSDKQVTQINYAWFPIQNVILSTRLIYH